MGVFQAGHVLTQSMQRWAGCIWPHVVRSILHRCLSGMLSLAYSAARLAARHTSLHCSSNACSLQSWSWKALSEALCCFALHHCLHTSFLQLTCHCIYYCNAGTSTHYSKYMAACVLTRVVACQRPALTLQCRTMALTAWCTACHRSVS